MYLCLFESAFWHLISDKHELIAQWRNNVPKLQNPKELLSDADLDTAFALQHTRVSHHWHITDPWSSGDHILP